MKVLVSLVKGELKAKNQSNFYCLILTIMPNSFSK